MDYYSILGINKNASPQEVKKAYKKACMKHHPDRGGSEEHFKKINDIEKSKLLGYGLFLKRLIVTGKPTPFY